MNDDNTIALLKQALMFYANENNYKKTSNNDQLFSLIEMDSGAQAKYALDLIETLEETNKSDQEIYEKYIELMNNDPNNNQMTNIRDMFKNIDPNVNINDWFNDDEN